MATDERHALWTAIRAHPDDDTPRLVYADWLQERGEEERAEFIRVQIELERLKADPRKGRKQRAPLEAREKALLDAYREEWLAPFVKVVTRVKRRESRELIRNWVGQMPFSRGFLGVDRLELERARLLSAADATVEPVEVLRVVAGQHEYDEAGLAAFARWAGSNSLVQLQLTGAANDGVAAVTGSEHFRSLAYLELTHGSVSLAGVRQNARWPRAAGLFVLDLRGNPIT